MIRSFFKLQRYLKVEILINRTIFNQCIEEYPHNDTAKVLLWTSHSYFKSCKCVKNDLNVKHINFFFDCSNNSISSE